MFGHGFGLLELTTVEYVETGLFLLPAEPRLWLSHAGKRLSYPNVLKLELLTPPRRKDNQPLIGPGYAEAIRLGGLT
jgi:hypothetical protein